MSWLSSLFIGLAILSVLALSWTSYLLIRDHYGEESTLLEKRMRDLASESTITTSLNLKKRVFANYPALDAVLRRSKLIQNLDDFILKSGRGWLVSQLLLLEILIACALFAIGIFLQISIWFVLPIAGLMLSLPFIAIQILVNRRVALLEIQLPDVLDFVARSMQAGHAFTSALQMAATESPQPIGKEFTIALNEVNFGIPIHEVLGSLADRVDSPDMRYFSVAVLINREVGGDLAGLLQNLSALIRDRLNLRQSVQAMTAEGRTSAWILGVLPFGVFALLYFFSPQFVSVLWHDPLGIQLMVFALGLMGIGVLWMRYISRLKV